MVSTDIGTGLCHVVLRGELGALGFEHDLKIHQTAAVTLASQQRGVTGCLRGALQAQQALAVAMQGYQRVFHVFQRRQHGCLICHEGLIQRCR